ncbi:hypothetical protein B9Q08_00535 [Candidatus Marsarchaeota G2 archaeon ECH_B_SAG-M15]|uniref:Solute-binding protein family 5 domain-containing protein n=1 Tax=Candidatus Marsarchaeota G2 archaeon ECH_B_SAG-M15 TaxID=1978162 RepID=A0A2R6B2V2_9ARCH|nr:MAG: hypothetical protein B9Q08_00535 [Candidatus Marsarchaeota G2 archaeon ECH_B_SAG-M15]
MLRHNSFGIGRIAAIAIVVIVLGVFATLVVVIEHRTTTPTPQSPQTTPTAATTTSTASQQPTSTSTPSTTPTRFTFGPPNTSVLVDDSQIQPPDALDPATGFTIDDEYYFDAVFQQLVEFNGSNYQIVPVLASNYSVENNYQSYIFQIRPNVTFSDGHSLNAYDVWFSFVRELYLGQAVGISNYYELTVEPNSTSSGYVLPWGIRHAIQAATGLPATTNINLTISVLNNMLSNFNPSNTTQAEIMSYPQQAYVVLGPMSFRINLLHHYPYFLQVIAAWWGAIVDPAYVDSHGGVQANTQNSYFDANSGPSTGPYTVISVGPGFSDIVLEANPSYWGKYAENVPFVAQPAHIRFVVINYGLPHNSRVEDFATNRAQISYVSVPFFGQMYSAYQYREYFSFKRIFFSFGLLPGLFYVSMNTQRFPTNNTYFRLAIVHAINYTEILYKTYVFNGSLYASPMLGPVSPGLPLYNPSGLPAYSYDPNLAAEYLNLAGKQEDFSVTLPNGSVIGNPSSPPLGTLTITYIAPLTPLVGEQLLIIQDELAQIGLSVATQGITASQALSWTSPQATPNLVYDAWVPDWVDPVLQLVAPAVTTSSYLPAWVNLSSINQIMGVLPFTTNQTQRVELMSEVYNITYNYAPYVWLPDPYEYYFVQPYVHGLVGDPLFGYWYNTLYYANATAG